jgi:hypothetical protein
MPRALARSRPCATGARSAERWKAPRTGGTARAVGPVDSRLVSRFAEAVAAHTGLLVALSILTMLIGLVLVPALIVRIPEDYFLSSQRHALSVRARHPLARLALHGAKNAVGALFLAAGVALLFLPGQGLLTLIAGLLIMNYPGKYAFECWLVRRPKVLPALNWLRSRYGRPPLKQPDA